MNDLFINDTVWKKFTPDQMEEYRMKVFNYYRDNGFPYYPTGKTYRLKELDKIKSFDFMSVIDGNVIRQTMHGLGLAWSYHPHSWDIRCGNMKTPMEVYLDDDLFYSCIVKRTTMGTYISDSGIRKMLKIMSGVQSVSNFRPTAAASIYETYAPGGVVWDMSGGFGGRFLGAMASSVKTYIATEPSSDSYRGLVNMSGNLADMNVELYKQGSEDFIPKSESLDLCFTSPPYFNWEKYSDEETQSYMKFPKFEDWKIGYLKKTFENCYYGLKKGCKMLINIANTKSASTLEEDTISLAKEVGFRHCGHLELALSSLKLRNRDEHKYKYEPIFVFEK